MYTVFKKGLTIPLRFNILCKKTIDQDGGKMNHTFAPKEITLIGIFAAITAILSQITLPLPFTPVPLSLGLVAVYTAGILLKPQHAVLSQLCYLLLGAIGLPIYAGFRGGFPALLGPTGGYLMAYPIIAGVVSWGINRKPSQNLEKSAENSLYVKSFALMLLAQFILYMGGTLWFSLVTGNTFSASLVMAVYPFIPLDGLKIAFCTAIIIPFRSRMLKLKILMLE